MATEGLFYAVTGPGGKKRSVDINAGVFGYANGNSSVGGSELGGGGGGTGEGTAGWLKGMEDRENNEGGNNYCKFVFFFLLFFFYRFFFSWYVCMVFTRLRFLPSAGSGF